MAHEEGPSDLPATWPFRAAGTLVIIALAWFCLGFAIKDQGETLAHHMQVFWLLLLAGLILVIGGAAFNISRERRRTRQG
jgi:peptidoglycan/LPS O-acetylase OafA/YrhL